MHRFELVIDQRSSSVIWTGIISDVRAYATLRELLDCRRGAQKDMEVVWAKALVKQFDRAGLRDSTCLEHNCYLAETHPQA